MIIKQFGAGGVFNDESSEELEEIYNILDMGFSGAGNSNTQGSQTDNYQRILPMQSSAQFLDTQNMMGTSSYLLGTVKSPSVRGSFNQHLSVFSNIAPLESIANTPKKLIKKGESRPNANFDINKRLETETLEEELDEDIENSLIFGKGIR